MVDVDVKTRREAETESAAITRTAEPIPARIASRQRLQIFPLLITLAMAAVAVVLGRAMWDAYMGAPWTRDGTVRVYVVTMAPQVAGQIVELPVKDNQFVHKGDLLMVIDPTDYKIAVSLNEAAVQQAQANALNAERESKRRQELTALAATVEEKQTFASNAVAVQAQYQQAVAKLEQARVNLQRTEIRSPVNGWVTNLLAQLGDYANVGANVLRRRCRLVLGRRLFRGDQSGADSRRRPGRGQADGLSTNRARSCRQHCPRHQRCERAAQWARACQC
jgi:multidrug resistance efflux pump